ncbi:MAG: acyl-CoA dehydrogenase [Pseudomonadota bacterium]|nr:acyl-CoA dehydrogenase [Pseudomonadota bacterium]
MSDFTPPLNDIRYTMRELASLCHAAGELNEASLSALPGYEEASDDVIDAILEEAGRLASDVLAPLNRLGDNAGCQLENGVVRTPDGFKEAFQQMAQDGWVGMLASREHGGQGLPNQVAFAAFELWSAANMAFGLIPLLGFSAIELLENFGTEKQKTVYLGRLISGEWTSTMNLTEPQAGSDLGRLTTRAVPEGNHYRLTGQKIFITGGEHDWTSNIIHLVLARLPDAPAGSAGISLFLVPKFLVNPDGSLGARNDLRCVSIEEKLGIHASPTCTMSYGDDGGAVGYLVGEAHKGLGAMFTMMNMSRLTVGIQGVGAGERAYQQALAYAQERIQGSRKTKDGGRAPVAIIQHPDVKRMLLSMKSLTEAHRAVALYTALCADMSKHHPDAETRAKFNARLGLLTPIVKAWVTDGAIEVTNLGIQIHGGAGFIEETGAAQHYRDARITTIYEGTNGIQAGDLLGRKIFGDGGKAIAELITDIKAASGIANAAARLDNFAHQEVLELQGLAAATRWVLEPGPSDEVAVVSYNYLTLVGNVLGGWMLSLTAASAAAELARPDVDRMFLEGKILSARQYSQERLSQSPSLAARIMRGGDGTANATVDHFQRL